MANQDLLEELLVEEQPAPKHFQSSKREKQPTLVEGSFQPCEGHIERRSTILKRWKKEYIKVIPGVYIVAMGLYQELWWHVIWGPGYAEKRANWHPNLTCN